MLVVWRTSKRLVKRNKSGEVFYFCCVNRISSVAIHKFLVIILLALSVSGQAQYYSLGSDPQSVRWSQSNVKDFKLIFPDDQTAMADQFSKVFFDISKPVTASMKSDIRKLAVIMHSYASFSNGSSILAPRRIELFPKQPIALETNEFIPQLAIHETRHFAQMESLNDGFTKIAGYLLGDQAQSIVLGIHVPNWLLEGDAVLTETLLSDAGRGRIASFMQPLRSRLIDNKNLAYDRMLFGSYREIMPTNYLYGYFLTARGRMLTDPMVWSDALRKIGKNPFNIKGISGLTRPKTGYRLSKLYVETMAWLRDYWSDPAKEERTEPSIMGIKTDTLEYVNYYSPQPYNNQSTVCLKKSLGDLPAFVIIDSLGNETTIARPGDIEDAGYSFRNGKLVWAELIQDARWKTRSWSEIYLYDCAKGKKKRLTYRKRYFSPVFSPSGDRIAAINEQPDGSSFLEIIDPSNGWVIYSIADEKGDHYSYLNWGTNQDELIAITTGPEGRKLLILDLAQNQQRVILNAGMADITYPLVDGDQIYFAGPVGTTQGLYRIDRFSRVIQMVFGHRQGINYLSSNGYDLFFSVYSSNGYRPAKVSFNCLSGTLVSRIAQLEEPVTKTIQRAEGEFPIVYSDTIHQFVKEPYNKFSHLLRLHSWSPVFINPDSYQISPGMVMMSQNDLSTLTCWAGYQFNKPDLSHNMVASFRYTGLFPSLEMDFSRKYLNLARITDRPGQDFIPYQQFIKIGAGLPLSFSSGAWYKKIEPSLFFQQIGYLQDRKTEFNRSAYMVGFSLSGAILRNTSYRDLFPRWGMSMNLSLFKAFTKTKRVNNMTSRIVLYLPGLLPNSSIRVLNSISMVGLHQFYSLIQDYPRGRFTLMSNYCYNFKFDYALPIAYPDYSLSWLIYIKRIKADLFFDAGTPLYEKNWFSSTGFDLTIDYHLLRIGILLESGIRAMYFPTVGKIGAEFLFSFSVK